MSGFLGSGKTSLILSLAKGYIKEKGARIAIIENDFTQVSVDARYISLRGMTVKDLCTGCICCTKRKDLLSALYELEEQDRPDIVIIEPSGIANPGCILSALEKYRGSELSKIISVVLVDGSRFDEMMPAFEMPLRNQLTHADLAIISKIDKVDRSGLNRVCKWLFENYPGKSILQTNLSDLSSIDIVRKRLWA